MGTLHHDNGAPAPRPADLAGVVDGIGSESFGARLVGFLHEVCGADHCAVFQLDRERIWPLAFASIDPAEAGTLRVERYVHEGLWRKDPSLQLARALASTDPCSVIRLNLGDPCPSDLRTRVYETISDRILVHGRRENVELGLSVLRSRSRAGFLPDAMTHLTGLANTLLAAMAKHVHVLAHQPNVANALTPLTEIEECLVARTALPRRELEVCARILYGMPSVGIGLDLGIGEQSVKTYRKRAYKRLGIGSERELLQWYLRQWSLWRGHLFAPLRGGWH